MNNLEQETIQFIQNLPSKQQAKLLEIIEWEKELSWSSGYADAVDHYDYGFSVAGEA